MSSPVHHPYDLDEALRYAPPWARKANTAGAASPGDPAAESTSTSLEEDDYDPPFDGDQAMLALQRRLALDPDQVPEPPVRMDDRPTLDRIALRLCAVAGIAGLVAWAAMSLPADVSLPIKILLPIKPQVDEVAQASEPQAVVAPALTATPVRVMHIRAAMAPLPLTAAPPVEAVTPVTAATPATPAIVPVRVAEATPNETPRAPETTPAADPPQSAAKTLTLAPDEIEMLVKRGKDLLTNGDISSARLLLQRAAEAGNAEAALALGSTFDPVVIARMGAIGVEADAARARGWYEKAVALGSNRASQQLANLAEGRR